MKATNCLNLCTALAVCAVAGTTTSVLAGGPKDVTPKLLTSGIKVTPKLVAGARFLPDGRISMTTSWMDYTGRTTRDTQTDLAFDNYEPQGASGSAPGYPTDGLYGLDCGMGTSRWFFGTAYCNVYYTNDIQKFTNDAYQGKSSTRAQWAWYFACDGASSEHCLVAVFTAEDFDDSCSGPDVGGSGYSGVIADFGTIGCNPGGYYFTDVDLSTTSLSYTLPQNNGAYQVFFLQNFSTSTGSGTLSSCAQPMLWGTKPGNPSQQGPIEWDDDGGVGAPGSGDGTHTAPTECYDMTFGVCPDPLGGMFCFYGESLGGGGCRPDCNLDTKATVNDFICFQNKWKTKDPYGDYNKDGVYNINDFIAFQAAWKKWQQTGDCGT
jgi:hypothetical protein